MPCIIIVAEIEFCCHGKASVSILILMDADLTLVYTAEVWIGEYQGPMVEIKMLKDQKDVKATQRFLAEAATMT